MADKSKIQWCDATINPCYGCWPVSPACANCYAARTAHRLGALTEGTHKDGRWTDRINLFPQKMEQVLRWRKPRRIFIGSMTDLFHRDVPEDFLDQVFMHVALAPRHTFMVLTKRVDHMRAYFTRCSRRHHTQILERAAMDTYGEDAANAVDNALDEVLAEGHNVGWPMCNLILMATVEDQPRADERMPDLLALAAAGWTVGVSVEPMLGPVDLAEYLTGEYAPEDNGGAMAEQLGASLSWVICGGESGPNARPMHPDWARSLRDQCQAADVPFFFKQWGEWGFGGGQATHAFSSSGNLRPLSAGVDAEAAWPCARIGKRHSGRLLDGTTHDAFPEVA